MFNSMESERIRKRRNNFFRRGYEIGAAHDIEVFIVFKKKGKFHTFTNMDKIVLPTQEDFERNLVVSRTSSDFDGTQADDALPKIKSPTFSLLGITTPKPPQLDLSF